jgi:hypothetical protein
LEHNAKLNKQQTHQELEIIKTIAPSLFEDELSGTCKSEAVENCKWNKSKIQ